ncbi:MAG: tripartite tricarboxylate transporter substrate binding protein [Burkholderiaceae bacterium]|jgi:tripartite-type tricarboxylate transporter receptor subunit TctC|nr:tripartite tricarboxylate transporter substrate binding protein [Burkholderiaceae bacterium]
MNLRRRQLNAWMLGAPLLPLPLRAATAPAAVAPAPAWPSQPLTVVVPFSPGGSVDVAARLVMPRLAERLGQPVVIENTVGASGTIAAQRVIKARPDGHTLLFGVASAVVIAPLVSPALHRYDGLRDLLPVAPVASSAFVLAARPGLPVADAAQLVQLARQQPGRLSLGTDGVGTGLHLTAELIQQMAGMALMHVPYKSGPQALAELAGGQIDLAVLPVALVQSFVREGKVKGLGVTSRQRIASLPQTPSLSETPALQALDVEAWQGLLLPARTDARIAERLAQDVAAVLAEPATALRLTEAGFKPMSMPQDRFIAYLEQERQWLEATVRKAGIRVD